jgi:hypothetical protein
MHASSPPAYASATTSLSNDWSASDLDALLRTSAILHVEPLWLIALAMRKSDARTTHVVRHSKTGAPRSVGLFDLECSPPCSPSDPPSDLAASGWRGTPEEFLHLSPAAQLHFVERHLSPYACRMSSFAALLVADFWPMDLPFAGDPNAVLVDTRTDSLRRLAAYLPNRAFDPRRRGWFTVSDLVFATTRACEGPRWDELTRRLSERLPPSSPRTLPPCDPKGALS